MPRNSSCGTVRRVAIDGVSTAFASESTTLRFDVPDEVGSFHLLLCCAQDEAFSSNLGIGREVPFKLLSIAFEDQLDGFA